MPDANGGTKTSLVAQALAITQAKNASAKGSSQVSAFSAGEPINPTVQQPTRAFDFVPGWNRTFQPRAYEPYSFQALRAWANVELVRLAIETRKDQLCRLGWRVKQRDEVKGTPVKDAGAEAINKLFRKPDGRRTFSQWFRVLLEDMLAIDAATIERRRTRGGQLIGLDVIPGDTIKILIDDTGRTPLAPSPAYQQVIRGLPHANLTTDDIIYAPRNVRPTHVYGCSAVEQIIVTINVALRRQTSQLAWFTEGNLPRGLATLPKGWTADQIKQYQQWFDSLLSGNEAERSKLIWGPEGSTFNAFKDPPLKDEFDEWLARVICFAFSLPATAFIKQLNRSTSETSDTTALEEGMEPSMLWWKDIADEIIATDLGRPDLEWGWERSREVDPLKQAQINDIYLKGKVLMPDEVRGDLGRGPRPDGKGMELVEDKPQPMPGEPGAAGKGDKP